MATAEVTRYTARVSVKRTTFTVHAERYRPGEDVWTVAYDGMYLEMAADEWTVDRSDARRLSQDTAVGLAEALVEQVADSYR